MAGGERKTSNIEKYRKPIGVGAAVGGLILGGVPGTLAVVLGAALLFFPSKKEDR